MRGFYQTEFWRALRLQCLKRDHWRCATAGCTNRAIVADHVLPRSRGGADVLDNLVARCLVCHNRRRGTDEPHLPGCTADGLPRDRQHWWYRDKTHV